MSNYSEFMITLLERAAELDREIESAEITNPLLRIRKVLKAQHGDNLYSTLKFLKLGLEPDALDVVVELLLDYGTQAYEVGNSEGKLEGLFLAQCNSSFSSDAGDCDITKVFKEAKENIKYLQPEASLVGTISATI